MLFETYDPDPWFTHSDDMRALARIYELSECRRYTDQRDGLVHSMVAFAFYVEVSESSGSCGCGRELAK